MCLAKVGASFGSLEFHEACETDLALLRASTYVRCGPESRPESYTSLRVAISIKEQETLGCSRNKLADRAACRERPRDPWLSHQHPVCPLIQRTAEVWVSGRFSAEDAQRAPAAPPGGQIGV